VYDGCGVARSDHFMQCIFSDLSVEFISVAGETAFYPHVQFGEMICLIIYQIRGHQP